MERIPQEVIEAAKLDGVGVGRELFGIILPMIWPTISTLLITGNQIRSEKDNAVKFIARDLFV